MESPSQFELGEHPGNGLPARTLVALCTFNELENLPSLISAIHANLPTTDILVVDDNSPDGSPAWLIRESALRPYLHCEIRENERGLGGAVTHAMKWAIRHHYEWLLNLDADHSHAPTDLPRLLETATASTPALDCVVGTRYAAGGAIEGWSLRRRIMSRMVNSFATNMLRIPVSDCSGSLRCYRVDKLAAILQEPIRNRGYAFFEEILLRLRRHGASFGEVPITFHERTFGESKLTLKESLRGATGIVRLLWE